MMVIALTAFVGLSLVTCFLVLFVCQAAQGGGSEHESLLPLADEIPVRATATAVSSHNFNAPTSTRNR